MTTVTLSNSYVANNPDIPIKVTQEGSGASLVNVQHVVVDSGGSSNNTSSAISIAVLDGTQAIAMAGKQGCAFAITAMGHASNVLTAQITIDGTNWLNILVLNIATNITTTTVTATGSYSIDLPPGIAQVRVKMTSYTSGTLAGIIVATASAGNNTDIRSFINAYSVGNSSVAQLTSGSTFTGAWEADLTWQGVSLGVNSDTNLTIVFEQSTDGVTADHADSSSYLANSTGSDSTRMYNLFSNYHRIKITNTGTATTTTFFCNLYLTPNWAPVAGRALDINGGQPTTITADMGTQVARGLVPQMTFNNKFGRNIATATGDAIWSLSTAYTEPASAQLCNVVSTDVNDDGSPAGTGARTVTITGINDSYDIVTETVTMNGTTNVSTVNKYWNIHRAFVATAGTDTGAIGTITIISTAAGTPTIGNIAIGYNQTQSTVYMVPRNYSAYINLPNVAGQNTTVNSLCDIGCFKKDFGGVFRIQIDFLLTGGATAYQPKVFGAPLKWPEKSTILFKCIAASGGGTWDVAVDYSTA